MPRTRLSFSSSTRTTRRRIHAEQDPAPAAHEAPPIIDHRFDANFPYWSALRDQTHPYVAMRIPGGAPWVDDELTANVPAIRGLIAIARAEPALKEAIAGAIVDSQALLMSALTALNDDDGETRARIAVFFRLSEEDVDPPFISRLREDFSTLLGYLRALETSDGRIFSASRLAPNCLVVALSQKKTGAIHFNTDFFIQQPRFRRAWCLLHEIVHTVLGGTDIFYAESGRSGNEAHQAQAEVGDAIELHRQLTAPVRQSNRRLPDIAMTHRAVSFERFLSVMNCRSAPEMDRTFRKNKHVRVGLLLMNPDSMLTLMHIVARLP